MACSAIAEDDGTALTMKAFPAEAGKAFTHFDARETQKAAIAVLTGYSLKKVKRETGGFVVTNKGPVHLLQYFRNGAL